VEFASLRAPEGGALGGVPELDMVALEFGAALIGEALLFCDFVEAGAAFGTTLLAGAGFEETLATAALSWTVAALGAALCSSAEPLAAMRGLLSKPVLFSLKMDGALGAFVFL
jgi:hypothetical protein